ncbi:MAG TPA: radical SAM family heme chaperone HemW [Aggregatilineaceae bacterium]|nr:radical SAM family heme chaperone HemW [Aggregatilineaceae bacterium]
MTATIPCITDVSTLPEAGYLPDSLLALYVHIPFCRTRCSYCAFNTYAGLSDQITPYMRALTREIRLVAGSTRRRAHTVYFGGGTPSLAPVSEIAAALETCAEGFELTPYTEITLEANPGTVDQEFLTALRHAGVNRLSIGMQSAHANELRLLARRHPVHAVHSAVDMARAAGFENINLDLIYGIPRQTTDMWRLSVNTAIGLAPDHLSLYSLSMEDATPMQRQVARGRLETPDPDLAADMYEWASDRLAAAGFEQYEISNWSRPGLACRHNRHVWRNLPYVGLGAGAHGYAAHTRYANVLHPMTYIARLEAQAMPLAFPLSAAAEDVERIGLRTAMSETMIMGLRLTQEGVSPEAFRERFGYELWGVFGQGLDGLIAVGLLERTADSRVRLTPRGRLLGNRVFMEFVEEN